MCICSVNTYVVIDDFGNFNVLHCCYQSLLPLFSHRMSDMTASIISTFPNQFQQKLLNRKIVNRDDKATFERWNSWYTYYNEVVNGFKLVESV